MKPSPAVAGLVFWLAAAAAAGREGWTAFGHASIDADGSVIVAGTARLQFGGPGAVLVKLDPDAVFYGGFED